MEGQEGGRGRSPQGLVQRGQNERNKKKGTKNEDTD